jgi:hypothetical protein
MSGSYYTLNNKYNQLLAILNSITGGGGGGVPTSSNLAVVLGNGNSAGTFDIDMNNNDILQVDNIDLVTINGSAYPPVAVVPTLQEVLSAGNQTDQTIQLFDSISSPTVTTNLQYFGISSNSNLTFQTSAGTLDITSGDYLNLTATNGITIPSEVAFTNAIAPTCLANPQGATDLCNKQYVDSQSALTAYQLYFNYSVPYTVPSGATYKTLSSTQVNTPTTVAWSTSSTAPVFLGGFFNLLSNINISSISAGVWTLLAFANLTNIAGQGKEAFFYTIIGTAVTGAETILYTSPASLLLNTVTPLIGSVSIQGTIPLIPLTGYTGIGIKLYIQSNVVTPTTGSVFFQTLNSYSSILTSVLPISAISNLSLVLTAGNSAGASNIDMNGNEIANVSVIDNTGNSITIGNGGADNIIVSATDSLTLVAFGSIGLTAKDTALPSGKGISITSDTPNIYYQLATGVNDRLTIDNNGTIETVSVTNQQITSVSPNAVVLQKPDTFKSLDMTCDTGLDFKTSGVSTATLSTTQLSFTASATMGSVGYRGNVYHTDNPTTNATYYLTFVQSAGVSGYYSPTFDSATLTYNPSTNLMAVQGLQLSTSQVAPISFTAGVLTIGCNDASQRNFAFPITANMTGLTLNNRRINGVYTIAIANTSASPWTISVALTGSAVNRTSYVVATVAVGDSWIMTVKVQQFGATIYNCVSLERFV